MLAIPTGSIGSARLQAGRHALAAGALVLGLTALRVLALALSDLDLHGDEAQYWSWAQDPAFGYFSKPPMVAWIIAATTAACGDGEFCVRLASPLIHALTAGVVFVLARSLYDPRIAAWSAVTYATLPGVSFSSALISTDVPLLLFWSLALVAFVHLLRRRASAWAPALALGVALGLGLLSKYAMVYFPLCAAAYCAATPGARWFLTSRQALLALAVAAAILAPNLLWNLDNGWATLGHTAANANWGGTLFHPDKMIEFLGAQFGVFGPILFAGLLWWLAAWRPRRASEGERLLLFFSVPVLALMVAQALLSRAHANWAAVAYPGATVAVLAWFLHHGRERLAKLSLGLHVFAAVGLSGAIAAGSVLPLPASLDPFARLRGWNQLGREVAARMAERPGTTVLSDDRMIMAELLYYTRERDFPIVIWDQDGVPGNHYELTAPLDGDNGARVLYVARWRDNGPLLARFETVRPLGALEIPKHPERVRRFYLYDLANYQ
ncbi:MAG: glycosyltransferase family 39 protein [Proteobacteria bacterium]|nr:glycosyltransferase family 39 protein [Pseudomonadota bacterium]